MSTRFRFVTLGLVVSLIVINYIDRSAVSYAVGPLEEAFGITTAQYGIISSVFSVGYMVAAFLSGPLVDRFGCRRVLLTAVVLFSITTALIPVAGSFAGLLVIRLLLGIGEAPAFPAATRTVSRWLPVRERGVALALCGGVAVSGSLLISGPLLTGLMDVIGWRGMFWTLAVFGVVWAVIATALLRDLPQESRRVNAAERELIASGQEAEAGSGRAPVRWRPLLTNRNLWVVAGGYFAWGFMFWGFMYWLPSFLSHAYGLSVKQAGAFSIAPWACGIVGALAGGVIVDRVYRRSPKIRSRFGVMGVALLLAGCSLVPLAIAPTLTVAVISISLGVGFGFVTGGIWWVASIDAAPDQPGSAAGFADAAFASSGIVAPSVMGFIVSSTGSFTSGFVVMAGLAVAGALLMLLVPRERTSSPEAATAATGV
ncbi:MFS transporter [Saccharopolyspora rhizosphaerae]|uniref:MFS transporter n=1 Tax=Saccharopolyspora rhizosphaerae TaxID=2492662 RepID=A0A426K1H0_9PSEU|nr:MFS transporter [Saccharopolyspora rhizosphaerae]RRO19377.1 MFS transporter [Saccharopolyspora rhizosphaerae]